MEENVKYMKEALREAQCAAAEDEVPIGAVVVCRGRVIAKGHNMTERLNDPTAHAEMIAITAATEAMGGKYLNDCTIYVTVEPCPMCAGGIINSRIETVRYGAKDDKAGACGSVLNLFEERFNHHPRIYRGPMEAECEEQLQEFFRNLR